MKILRFNDHRIGVLKNEANIADISELIPHRELRGPQGAFEYLVTNFETLRSRIEDISSSADELALSSVSLLAPIPRPGKCLAAFANYIDSLGFTRELLPNEFFHKCTDLVGPGGETHLPDIEDVLVFQAEAELAFVIGKEARKVTVDEALSHVFGYVPFFDVSARGLIRRSQFLPKGQASFALCGPWITTADEVPDPHALRVKSWLNGKPSQDYVTHDMANGIPEQIAWLSRFSVLHPGDLISTGTNHDGLVPINPGDVLEIEVVGLGRAEFGVSGESPRKDAPYIPGKTVGKPLQPGMLVTRVD